MGVNARAAPGVGDAQQPAHRQLLQAAGWAMPAFMLLPFVELLPDIAALSDPVSYLAIHSVMEAFSCAVCVLVFGVGWHAARAAQSTPVALLSASFLAVALLDLAHTLSFQGMPRFVTPSDPEKAIVFWLAARYAAAAGLLLLALVPARSRIEAKADSGYYIATAVALAYTALILWLVLLHADALPRTFIAGAGLTPVKVAAEYGVAVLYLAAVAALVLRAPGSLNVPVPALVTALLFLVASELAHTLFETVNDAYNFVGHVYKVIAFVLIYRAIFVHGVTEPYRMRVASEQLYRQLTEQAVDAIFKLDAAGAIAAANPRAGLLTGRDWTSLPGQKLADLLVAPGDRTLAGATAALAGSGNAVFEAVVKRPDGSNVPVEINIGPLPRAGALAIARDIGERKRAEEDVRIRDAAFSTALMPIMIAHPTGKLTYVNRAFLAAWGYKDESDVIGRSVAEFAAGPAVIAPIVQTLWDTGRWSGETQARRRDGTLMDVQLAANLVTGANGEPICMIGLFRDVTEQKRMLAALQRNEELLRAAAQAAEIGIYDHDHLSDTIYWSHEKRAQFGVGRDEVITLPLIFSLIHPEDRERVESALRRAHDPAGDGLYDVQHRIVRRNGDVRWLINRGRTFFEDASSGPRPVRSIGVAFDVSERMRASEERAALESQLLQSQKMEAVGQLTGGVAHDFNNLLAVISGNLELLGEQLPEGEGLRKMLQTALRATARGTTLTRSLLAFARKQPLEPQAIDVGSLMREMSELLHRTVPENIAVEFVSGAGIWPCEADPGQLQNVLLNLVVNARDAMPDGGRLTIETGNARLDDDYAAAQAEVVPGQYVMLAVSDTGKGIAPENLPRVFEPFFTTKEAGKGTGLGLSMVYGFVKQSRGHVRIYSEVGHGTTVRIYLPRTSGNAEAPPPPPPADEPARGETVLVVEDDSDMRKLTRALLESLGYEVVDAHGTTQALQLLKDNAPIRLLLTDVMLRGDMNGRGLADAAVRLRPGLGVLYMSGYTENAIMHHGRLDPGVHLLQKPFTKRDLAAKVRTVLNNGTRT